MDYDPKQTGGNGFVIEFPESIDRAPLTKFIRNDGQGIQRLEMISMVEAMEELLRFDKNNPGIVRQAAGIEIYTDRLAITDGGLTNRFRLNEYRKNGWRNHEGKSIKDSELLNRIDKTRTKLEKIVGGRVEIKYEREKKNKIADKLSRDGKKAEKIEGKMFAKKQTRVIKRKFNGVEIIYPDINTKTLNARLYKWEPVGNQVETTFEIMAGKFREKKIKVYVTFEQKANLKRGHNYKIVINEIFRHHITAHSFKAK